MNKSLKYVKLIKVYLQVKLHNSNSMLARAYLKFKILMGERLRNKLFVYVIYKNKTQFIIIVQELKNNLNIYGRLKNFRSDFSSSFHPPHLSTKSQSNLKWIFYKFSIYGNNNSCRSNSSIGLHYPCRYFNGNYIYMTRILYIIYTTCCR